MAKRRTVAEEVFQTINGWTRRRMIFAILKGNSGRKSTTKDGQCRYTAPDGNHCGVGCFIPDEMYRPKMESMKVDQMLERFPELYDQMPLDVDGLKRLQKMHDQAEAGVDLRELMVQWIREHVYDGRLV